MKTDDFINIDEIVERHMNNIDKTSNINEQIWSEPIDDSFVSLSNKNKTKNETQNNKMKTIKMNLNDACFTKKADLFDSKTRILDFKLDNENNSKNTKSNTIKTKKTVNFSFDNLTSRFEELERDLSEYQQDKHNSKKTNHFTTSKTKTSQFDFDTQIKQECQQANQKTKTLDFSFDHLDNHNQTKDIKSTNIDNEKVNKVELKTKKINEQENDFSDLYNLNNHATSAFVQFENKYTNNSIHNEIEQENNINNKKTSNLSKFFSNQPSVELTTEINNNQFVSFNEPLESTQRKKGFFLLFSTRKKKKK